MLPPYPLGVDGPGPGVPGVGGVGGGVVGGGGDGTLGTLHEPSSKLGMLLVQQDSPVGSMDVVGLALQ